MKKLIAFIAILLSIALPQTTQAIWPFTPSATQRDCKTCGFLIAIDYLACSNHSNRDIAARFHAHMQNVMAKHNCTRSQEELQAAIDHAQQQEVQHRGSSSHNIIHLSEAWRDTAQKLKEELVEKHCPKPKPGE